MRTQGLCLSLPATSMWLLSSFFFIIIDGLPLLSRSHHKTFPIKSDFHLFRSGLGEAWIDQHKPMNHKERIRSQWRKCHWDFNVFSYRILHSLPPFKDALFKRRLCKVCLNFGDDNRSINWKHSLLLIISRKIKHATHAGT